jgi:non-heme chloroperoxidase
MVGDSRLVTVPGGPHGIPWTHADLVNRELMSFIA